MKAQPQAIGHGVVFDGKFNEHSLKILTLVGYRRCG
jgi:hypothetical protein